MSSILDHSWKIIQIFPSYKNHPHKIYTYKVDTMTIIGIGDPHTLKKLLKVHVNFIG